MLNGNDFFFSHLAKICIILASIFLKILTFSGWTGLHFQYFLFLWSWCSDFAAAIPHWYCSSLNSKGMESNWRSQISLGVFRELRGLSEQFRFTVATAVTGFRMNWYLDRFGERAGSKFIFS